MSNIRPQNTIIISDLHLGQGTKRLLALFRQFVEYISHKADSLYILGDFYEYWIGEDVSPELNDLMATFLQPLYQKNIPIYFIPGNRDFLITPRFLEKLRIQYLPDPSVVTLNQQDILLAHGDEFCTDERLYQFYRQLSHRPIIKKLFLKLPRRLRLAIAAKFRAIDKGPDFVPSDINQTLTTDLMMASNSKVLIHGHTHTSLHQKLCEKNQLERYVLGAWEDNLAHYIQVNATGISQQTFQVHHEQEDHSGIVLADLRT